MIVKGIAWSPIGWFGGLLPYFALLGAAMVLAAGPIAARAVGAEETEEAGRLTLTTRRLAAFKDGYCLVVKDAAGAADERGEVFTTEIPDAAVLGSFWATPAEGRLIAMVAGWEEREQTVVKKAPCNQLVEALLANQGAQAAVELHDRSVRTGQIIAVLTRPAATLLEPPQAEAWRLTSWMTGSAAPGAAASQRIETPSVSGVVGEFFVLRTESGDALIPLSHVRLLTIPDMKTTLERTVTRRERTKRLTFRFAQPAPRRELSLMYFRPGLRWIPSYRIELTEQGGGKRATVALQAEILNEAEDFGEAALDLVVGVPNFRFRGLPSPLILEQALRNTLQQAEPVLMGQMQNNLSNALFAQRSGEFHREGAPAAAVEGGTMALPEELTAQGAQDLFVYRLPPLRLRRGERAAVPIFSANVPYRDVYTWDLRLTRQDIEAAPSGSGVGSPLVLSENEVWHQVVLTNNTDVPWTTGAAMLLEDGIPLSQELLTYTSPKDETRMPVTVSVDTRGSIEEEETGRQLQALTWNGSHYAKITKRARLELRNNKATPIEAEITFRFGGKATQASDEGEITLHGFDSADWTNYRGDPAVNNSSTVRWNVRLGPGETFRPTVTYHYYARH